jgi:methylated-DNA-[protein]-cysteine S-methyltransferase
MPTATDTLYYTLIDSPIGELLLVGDGDALSRLHMRDSRKPLRIDPEWERDDERFVGAVAQLREYFAGEREAFDVPLKMDGSEFQIRVWNELCEIPYGTTISYGELARRIGQPSAARGVGMANGSNPIAVIVPCHRVIGADGSLTGYGGGLKNKRTLLDLERGALC